MSLISSSLPVGQVLDLLGVTPKLNPSALVATALNVLGANDAFSLSNPADSSAAALGLYSAQAPPAPSVAGTYNASAMTTAFNPQDVRAFVQFLQSHPEILKQVRKDPTLLTNSKFIEANPAFQDFLNNHPGVQQALQTNLHKFVSAATELLRQEEFQGELSDDAIRNFGQFLQQNPDIAQQLTKDASLATDPKFIAAHPAFGEFLSHHPGVRQLLNVDTRALLQEVHGLQQKPQAGIGALASLLGTFLKHHNSIDEELTRDPSLLNSTSYLKAHPQLRDFLQMHPSLREAAERQPAKLV